MNTPPDVYNNNWEQLNKILKVDATNSINHGLYDKGIHTHTQAIQHLNDYVENLIGLNQLHHITTVLDAGCGIGGTLLYLAAKHPTVHFTGITLPADQIQKATHLAKTHHLTNTTFHQGDFLHTTFPDNHFDAVYMIESACYAPHIQLLLKEMKRILTPQGRLIIIDCFRTNRPLNTFLSTCCDLFCSAWTLPGIHNLQDFKDTLQTEGFRDITTADLSNNVQLAIIREDIHAIPALLKLATRKLLKGRHYDLKKDPDLFPTASICISLLGLAHAISYNAVTATK